MAEKELYELKAEIKDLNKKIKFLMRTQQLIISHISKDNEKFMVEYMALALLQPDIRNGLSKELLGSDSKAPDNIKTLMMDINEVFSKKKGS